MNIPTLLLFVAIAAIIVAVLNRKLLAYASAVILLALIVYVQFYSSLDYDSEEWKAARRAGDYRTCHRMRGDLIKKLSATPLSLARLREELGEPDYLITPIYWRYRVKSADLIFPDDSFIDIAVGEDTVTKIKYTRG